MNRYKMCIYVSFDPEAVEDKELLESQFNVPGNGSDLEFALKLASGMAKSVQPSVEDLKKEHKNVCPVYCFYVRSDKTQEFELLPLPDTCWLSDDPLKALLKSTDREELEKCGFFEEVGATGMELLILLSKYYPSPS